MKLIKVVTISLCFIILVFAGFNNIVTAGESQETEERIALSEFEKSQKEEFKTYRDNINREYEIYRNIINEEFEKYKKKISSLWDEEKISDTKKWIEYSDDFKSRRIVDFENGTIEIEIIADNNTNASSIDKLVTKVLIDLAGETNRTAFKRDSFSSGVEKRLVKSINDIKTGSDKEEHIVSDMITGSETPDDKLIVSSVMDLKKNSVATVEPAKSDKEKVFSIKIQIPNERMQRKALKYVADVEKYSIERKLDPALVFAIMQTESSFNPMARSYIPAYGLMQIVPGSAGRDASKAVFGKSVLLSPSFLYNCENNIKIGTAYISVVMYKYLRAIKNLESRTYCAIAAYNTGTSNVARAFISKARMSEASSVINKMSPDEVYKALIEKLPQDETKGYLKKVTKRMKHYGINNKL